MKQKVSKEKMEQQYQGNGNCKDSIGESNAPTLCCCCCWYFYFGAVDATADNCLKINSTTKYLNQDIKKSSSKNTKNATLLKYKYYKIMIIKEKNL